MLIRLPEPIWSEARWLWAAHRKSVLIIGTSALPRPILVIPEIVIRLILVRYLILAGFMLMGRNTVARFAMAAQLLLLPRLARPCLRRPERLPKIWAAGMGMDAIFAVRPGLVAMLVWELVAPVELVTPVMAMVVAIRVFVRGSSAGVRLARLVRVDFVLVVDVVAIALLVVRALDLVPDNVSLMPVFALVWAAIMSRLAT